MRSRTESVQFIGGRNRSIELTAMAAVTYRNEARLGDAILSPERRA
jgi:hypothetical protein